MQKNENTKRKYHELESRTDAHENLEQSSTSSMNNQEESDEFYEVEEIVGKKTIRGKNHYQVKWVGYPSDQNTWEPLENLINVQNLIEEFERVSESLKRKKTSKKQPDSKEDQIEKVIEKYKDYGLADLMKNNIAPSKNKSRDWTRSTDENEEKSYVKSLNTSSANERFRIESESEGIVDKLKKLELMGNICNDKPLLIKKGKIVNKELKFLVKWEKRHSGLEPFDSWVKNEAIKKLYPNVLIEFYESKLKLIAQFDEDSEKNEN